MLEGPIVVLGAGNGGQCMAADLTLNGHVVNLYEHTDYADSVAGLLDSPVIELEGIGRQGRARLNLVTTDMGAAVAEASLINVVVPAYAQEHFFRLLLPHVRDGHVIVVWSGEFGSLHLRKLLEDERPGVDATVCETNTLPYGARLVNPGHVRLLLLAPSVLIAAVPAAHTAGATEALRPIFSFLRAANNVLQVAFNNPNPIVHPAGSLLNTGRIQYSQGEFWMYREGITEAVARVIQAVFDEIALVATALNVPMVEYEQRHFRTTASIMGVAFEAPFDTLGVIAAVKGPHTVDDRYVTEDLPFGLVPIVELARTVGVSTPVISALIEIGSRICRQDFWAEGRGLAELGLANMDAREMLEYLTSGTAVRAS